MGGDVPDRLRELVMGAFEGSVPWDAFTERLSQYRLSGSAAERWLREVRERTVPDRLLLAKALRYIDAGILSGRPVQTAGKSSRSATDDSGKPQIAALKGVGSKTLAALEKAGIRTLEDLVHYYPTGYEVFVPAGSLAEVEPDQDVLIKVRVRSFSMSRNRARGVVTDGENTAVLHWMHPYRALYARMKKGSEVWVAGRAKPGSGRHLFIFFHPKVSSEPIQSVRPIYPDVPGIQVSRLRSLIEQAMELVEDEILPPHATADLDLMDRKEAFRWVHSPPQDTAAPILEELVLRTHEAWRRIHYEEIFVQQVALAIKRTQRAGLDAPSIDPSNTDRITTVFPFELTGAQRRAIAQIADDMHSGGPMRRLLQGDVGSGKTAVAFTALALAALSGHQAAFMAPTTLLAQQHSRTLEPWARALGLSMRLVTGDTPKGSKESIYALARSGQLDILVGTHALIQDSVLFDDLALVVVDEQHRFGVAQRARLTSKGLREPHLLVMTATPIPRSLALSVYGHLELTVIDEMPPGREPVVTEVAWNMKQKTAVFRELDSALAQGGKAFVVAPLIEESEELDRLDVERVSRWISENLSSARMGVVHGRMKPADRDAVVQAFRAGKFNLLVATTVIEVGLDIPDAAYMIILDADTFGLAQLHQLRGRIGRSSGIRAKCYLFASGHPTDEGRRRLHVMASHSDGFTLAEEDMAIRGPGEILGTRQSGRDAYEAVVIHGDLIPVARSRADSLVSQGGVPDSHGTLAARVASMLEKGVFGEESG